MPLDQVLLLLLSFLNLSHLYFLGKLTFEGRFIFLIVEYTCLNFYLIEFVNAYLLLNRTGANTTTANRDRLNYILDQNSSTPGKENFVINFSYLFILISFRLYFKRTRSTSI